MRVRSVAVVCLLIAICFVMAVAAEVYLDEFVQPHTLFSNLLLGTVITSLAMLPITIEVPS